MIEITLLTNPKLLSDVWFSQNVHTSHSAVLTADITIDNSVVWTPIALNDGAGNGSTFNGNGHTITFANTREGSTFGLFARYNYSIIENLYLAGSISCNTESNVCMLACMLGNNREIFFPKLEEGQMMTFDSIATELLHTHGYRALKCASDEEAIEKAEFLKQGSLEYPVHYSVSNTSGEKAFEEFYTDSECVDMNRFQSLGVVTEKEVVDFEQISTLFDELERAFLKENVTKEDIVKIIGQYLPDFEHIEKGKSLDSKM